MIYAIIIFLLMLGCFFYLFYPQQILPEAIAIEIKTPEPEKYHNDCLHPCVRYVESGFAGAQWWMVQSPYYNRNNKLENPILYYSLDDNVPVNWNYTAIVQDTHCDGYNSDPCIFYEDGKLWVFWRECDTPKCKSWGVNKLTVGVNTVDGYTFSEPKIYLKQHGLDEDKEQCPILVKQEDKYLFYAVHYQYKPKRKAQGIVVWEGTSLDNPDFVIKQELKIPKTYTCDKLKQLRLFGKLFFVPWPMKHSIWHFDLLVFEKKLYMVSVDEWGDNIMLAESNDFKNFKFKRKPLINNHYLESMGGLRTYFYKPSLFISNGRFMVYYTETNSLSNKLKLARRIL